MSSWPSKFWRATHTLAPPPFALKTVAPNQNLKIRGQLTCVRLPHAHKRRRRRRLRGSGGAGVKGSGGRCCAGGFILQALTP